MNVRIEQLGQADRDLVRGLLTRDVQHNVYLLGLWEEYGPESFGVSPSGSPRFLGRFDGEALTAVLFVGGAGGLVVPSAEAPADAAEIAAALGPALKVRAAVGERTAVDAVLKAVGARPSSVQDQRLYAVSADDLGPFTNPTLRLAVEADLPRLVLLAAAAVRETMRVDPLARSPRDFEGRVHRRIQQKRTYVLEVGGELVFKVDVGSRSEYGAELEGLYTVPAQRHLGHATLCLGQIARHLLSSLPRLTLRIPDPNESLIRIARRVGFVGGKAMRSAMVGHGG